LSLANIIFLPIFQVDAIFWSLF